MKKFVKVAVTAVVGAMLMTGVAVASDDTQGPFGKNMTGEGLGQGSTKYFVTDYLQLEPNDIRMERRNGLSMVQIGEKNGVPGETLIDAVVQFRSDNLGSGCTIEDARTKITENLNKVSSPRANANPELVGNGNKFGGAKGINGDNVGGQARGWQR